MSKRPPPSILNILEQIDEWRRKAPEAPEESTLSKNRQYASTREFNPEYAKKYPWIWGDLPFQGE